MKRWYIRANEDVPRARTTDPETSHEAAASVKDMPRLRRAVYEVLRLHGPLADEDLVAEVERVYAFNSLTVSPSGVRSRRAELVRQGLVRDSLRRGTTASGRRAILWEATGGKDGS